MSAQPQRKQTEPPASTTNRVVALETRWQEVVPKLATKSDMLAGFELAKKDREASEQRIDAKIELVKKDMTAMEQRLDAKIETTESRIVFRLTRNMVVIVTLACAITGAIVKFL